MPSAAAPPCWLGVDVGGANLKVADAGGRALAQRFALWRRPDELAETLAALVKRLGAPADAGIALTMTGELADCYATKREGVAAIVTAAAAATAGPLRVATVDDRWLASREAIERPYEVAAANWRVAARWVATRVEGPALWVDVGSTTVDLAPLESGIVVTRGRNDTERLIAGELVYTGVRRTPICALVRALPFRGASCPVAAEWFATTADVWLWMGELSEDAHDESTADGRPLVRAAARDRLARCIGADRARFSEFDALAVAEAVARAQEELLAVAIARWGTGGVVVGSGEGTFLLSRALARAGLPTAGLRTLEAEVPRPAARALPAYAAAACATVELGTAP